MPPIVPVADAALASCSSLEDFSLFEPGLEAAWQRLALARAAGAALMLEAAFERHPHALSSHPSGDFDGGFDLALALLGASGKERDAKTALRALSIGLDDPASCWADEELARDFEASGSEGLRAAIEAFEAPYSYLLRWAPAIFWNRAADVRLVRACAPGLARQLGLPEVASCIEAARLARDCRGVPRPAVTPRL